MTYTEELVEKILNKLSKDDRITIQTKFDDRYGDGYSDGYEDGCEEGYRNAEHDLDM